ncbi:MAG: NAD(P)H-dependent oxidoreductase [Tepidisphaeraceae bacterium]
MAKLLHIESSPRKARSHSASVAHAFVDSYKKTHPSDTVDTWDVWHAMLPVFDGDTLNAKYSALAGRKQSSPESAAWETIHALADRLKTADKLLVSAPMWNFSIPYRLKHLIDLITQPGVTFGYDATKGYYGLVTGKPAVVVIARGGAYGPGSPAASMDFQKPYLEMWLRFIGFTDIRTLEVEPTLGNPEDVAKMKSALTDRAISMGAEF